MELFIMHFSPLSSYFFLLKPKSLPQRSLLKKPSSNVKGQVLHPQKLTDYIRIMYIFNVYFLNRKKWNEIFWP